MILSLRLEIIQVSEDQFEGGDDPAAPRTATVRQQDQQNLVSLGWCIKHLEPTLF